MIIKRKAGPFGFIGICLLLVGIIWTTAESIITRNYIKTTGVVVDYEVHTKRSSKGTGTNIKNYYKPIYEYEADGHKYKVSPIMSTRKLPVIGAERKIRYDSKNPQKAVMEGIQYCHIVLISGLAVIGVLFLKMLIYKNKGKIKTD